jgi:hypothetical protein
MNSIEAKDGWVRVKGPFGENDLRSLGRFGHIERLALEGQSIVNAAIARGLSEVVSVEHLCSSRARLRKASPSFAIQYNRPQQ